jgi:hypothetical protein
VPVKDSVWLRVVEMTGTSWYDSVEAVDRSPIQAPTDAPATSTTTSATTRGRDISLCDRNARRGWFTVSSVFRGASPEPCQNPPTPSMTAEKYRCVHQPISRGRFPIVMTRPAAERAIPGLTSQRAAKPACIASDSRARALIAKGTVYAADVRSTPGARQRDPLERAPMMRGAQAGSASAANTVRTMRRSGRLSARPHGSAHANKRCSYAGGHTVWLLVELLDVS